MIAGRLKRTYDPPEFFALSPGYKDKYNKPGGHEFTQFSELGAEAATMGLLE